MYEPESKFLGKKSQPLHEPEEEVNLIPIDMSGLPEVEQNAQKRWRVQYIKDGIEDRGNKVNVIVIGYKTLDISTARYIFNVGSRHENTFQTGFSHMIEHLLHNGLYDDYQKIGGEVLASTSLNTTKYYVMAKHGDFKGVLDVLIDNITNKGLDYDKFVSECDVCRVEASGITTGYVNGRGIFGRDHAITGPSGGLFKSITTFNDVEAFYKKFYFPGNSSMVLSIPLDEKGEFDVEMVEDIIDKVNTYSFESKLTKPINRNHEIHTDEEWDRDIEHVENIVDCKDGDKSYEVVIDLSYIIPPYYDTPRVEPLPEDILNKSLIWSKLKYRHNMSIYSEIFKNMFLRLSGLINNDLRKKGSIYEIVCVLHEYNFKPTEAIVYLGLEFRCNLEDVMEITECIQEMINNVILDEDGRYLDMFDIAIGSSSLGSYRKINAAYNTLEDAFSSQLNWSGTTDVLENIVLTNKGYRSIYDEVIDYDEFKKFLKLMSVSESSSINIGEA